MQPLSHHSAEILKYKYFFCTESGTVQIKIYFEAETPTKLREVESERV